MDIIYIEQLTLQTRIGVYDWEQEILQRLVLDIRMAHDVTSAGVSDDLTHTLDYKAISDRLTVFAQDSSFALIEAFAASVVTILQDEFSVPWVHLRVSKPDALEGTTNVGCEIERGTRIGAG